MRRRAFIVAAAYRPFASGATSTPAGETKCVWPAGICVVRATHAFDNVLRDPISRGFFGSEIGSCRERILFN